MSQACRRLLKTLPRHSVCKAPSTGVRRLFCHPSSESNLSPVAFPFRLQRLAGNAGRNTLSQPQYEFCAIQAFRLSSMASPEVTGKDGNSEAFAEDTTGSSGDEKIEPVTDKNAEATQKVDKAEASGMEPDSTSSEQTKSEDNEALLSLLAEREALLEEKEKQLAELKDRGLRSMAELENVRERLRREAENTKKYAIQDFAKSLLDVADNLGRAIATVPEQIRNDALAKDQSEIGIFLKSLLDGVMMTEKELMKIFKKFGVEKFEPVGQPFDPNLHLALFEVADPAKEAGTIAMVVKAGYMLHDRTIRPADVGVVKSLDS